MLLLNISFQNSCSSLLGGLSSSFWNLTARICSRSAPEALMKSALMLSLAISWNSKSSQRCFNSLDQMYVHVSVALLYRKVHPSII